MPSYAFLAEAATDYQATASSIRALAKLGTPYQPRDVLAAEPLARAEAKTLAADLEKQGITLNPDTEMVALIAYLQVLGVSPKTPKEAGHVSTDLSLAK